MKLQTIQWRRLDRRRVHRPARDSARAVRSRSRQPADDERADLGFACHANAGETGVFRLSQQRNRVARVLARRSCILARSARCRRGPCRTEFLRMASAAGGGHGGCRRSDGGSHAAGRISTDARPRAAQRRGPRPPRPRPRKDPRRRAKAAGRRALMRFWAGICASWTEPGRNDDFFA